MRKEKERETEKSIQFEKRKHDTGKSIRSIQISECKMDQSKTFHMITDKKKNARRESDVLRKWWSIQAISARQKKESPSYKKKRKSIPYE